MALALAVYLLVIVFGDQGLLELKSMQKQLNAIKQENAVLERQNAELYRSINRLKNDPAYIEQTARRELQLVRPEEIVFKFETGPGGSKNE